MKLSLGVKVLILFTCILFSVIVAMLAGWLFHDPGMPMRKSVLIGGGAFGGSLSLCLLALTSINVL